MRKLALAAALAALVLCFGGCAVSDPAYDPYLSRDDSHDTPVLERGSFEDGKKRLDAMTAEMVDALAEAFPDCDLQYAEGLSMLDGGSPEVNGMWPYTQRARWYAECSVADTRERSDQARRIVTDVGRKYGFPDPIVYNDSTKADGTGPSGKGDLAFDSFNADGDRYSFGSAVATTVGYDSASRFTAAQLAEFERDPDATPAQIPPAVETPGSSATSTGRRGRATRRVPSSR